MTKIAKPSRTFHAGSHLDDFLYALIGDDGNGRPLTVLSALARADVDPWLEAESLAKMPTQDAAERLRTLIDKRAGEGFAVAYDAGDASLVIDRLVALLPKRKADLVPASRSAPATNTRAVNWQLALYITIGLMLSIQFLARSAQRQPHPEISTASSARASAETKPR